MANLHQSTLIERERELAAVAALLAAPGRALCVTGEAGIGKSALLAAAAAQAGEYRVLTASGGALETGFAFGVARQLFGTPRLSGAAAAAAPALGLGAVGGRAFDAGQRAVSFELQHGLYWLVADLAESGPLLLIVDDAQWADPDSLAFLVFLARRLEGLPVALLYAVRSGEPCGAPQLLAALRELSSELTPAPLSAAATAAVVRARVDASDERCASLHEASRGNPFLLGALLDDPGRGPVAVQRSVLLRLARLGPSAVALAQAVAILERDARLVTAGALAGLDDGAAREAADALIAARIFEAAQPLRFVHPVVRAAVYADVGLARRAAGHRRAAELLDAGEPDRAALHLLATDPGSDPWVFGRLRAAADRALARGSTDGARSLLERALAEAAPEDRAETLLALGTAERRAGEPGAIAHLEEALALSPDVRIVRELAALHWERGELERAITVLDAAPGDPQLELEADRVAYLGLVEPDRALPPALEAAERLAGDTPAERRMLAMLAFHRMIGGLTTGAEVGRLAQRALGGGALLADVGPGHPSVLALLSTLQVVERVGDVAAVVATTQPSAPVEAAWLLAIRARLALFCGDLRAAEADAREALGVAGEAGLEHVRRFVLPSLVMILVERGELEAAATELTAAEAAHDGGTRWLFLQARVALAREQGRFADAAADARAAHAQRGGGSVLGAAVLALAENDPELAAAALAHAERWAVPSTTGMVLRANGLVTGDVELLRRAAAVLAPTPRRLEHARALVDLGAALRRGNARAQAQEPLAAGMELAHRCGAAALASRAREELVACGARPRRLLRTGVDALTPSELRVAQLAAAGRSNREIAQALFVTRKTVETHLGGIYRKLGVHSRELLAAKLQDPPPDAKPPGRREAVAP